MTGLAALILLAGMYFTFASKGFAFRRMPSIAKSVFVHRQQGGLSPFEALSAALSGTMGVGSIMAVTTALCLGGPGALVWMWISGGFAMMVKYAEVYLCVKHRQQRPGGYAGGPMFVLKEAAGKPVAAWIYAALCLAVSLFSMGNAAQASAMATVMEQSAGWPRLLSGVVLACVLLPLLLGGTKPIGRICGVVFPAMASLYVLGCALCLYLGRARLPQVLLSIWQGAFSREAFLSGTALAALKYGITRGLFSNEAGLGTSAMAHVGADVQSPRSQGMLGIAEVFINTLLLCTLSALVVLGSGVELSPLADGANLAMEAFSSYLGPMGGMLVTLLVLFFGLSTMPVWCMYGRQALGFMLPSNRLAAAGYRLVYILCAFVFTLVSPAAIWRMADLLNLLLALPNLYMLWRLRREVLLSTA